MLYNNTSEQIKKWKQCSALPWVLRFQVRWLWERNESPGPVKILWVFWNICEIKRKRVKHPINVVVAVWISPNTVQFFICFTAFFLHYRYWTHTVTRYVYRINMLFLNASNEEANGVGNRYGGFPGSVGMGILWGFPQTFCGYAMGLKSNPHARSPGDIWKMSPDFSFLPRDAMHALY